MRPQTHARVKPASVIARKGTTLQEIREMDKKTDAKTVRYNIEEVA